MTNADIIEMAIARAGGISKLAKAIGIRHTSIYVWKKIPAGRIIAIETATGIPRERLRPDLYRKLPQWKKR